MTPQRYRAHCKLALKSPTVQAFLACIKYAEHGPQWIDNPDVYRVEFGATLFPAEQLKWDKPRNVVVLKDRKGKVYRSSAKGAYQIKNDTWDGCKRRLGLADFLPISQDLAAVDLIGEGQAKALDYLLLSELDITIARCAPVWASLPGAPYGQPVKTMAEVDALYRQRLAMVA